MDENLKMAPIIEKVKDSGTKEEDPSTTTAMRGYQCDIWYVGERKRKMWSCRDAKAMSWVQGCGINMARRDAEAIYVCCGSDMGCSGVEATWGTTAWKRCEGFGSPGEVEADLVNRFEKHIQESIQASKSI